MTKLNAVNSLKHGIDFPYDAPDIGKARKAKDWAVNAARGVLADLTDRGGVKHQLNGIDYEVRKEIIDSIAAIIRLALAAKDGGDSPAQTALTDIIKSLMQTFTPMRYIHESTQEGILAHMEREDQRAYQILKAALAALTTPVAKEGE